MARRKAKAVPQKLVSVDLLRVFKEKTFEQVVVKEEGKGLSSNDFTDEYKQIVDDLNYKPIAINSMSATSQSNEIGATVTSTTVSFALNKTPKTLKIKFGSEADIQLDVNAKSHVFTDKNIKSNTNIILTATDERDKVVTKQVTITFQPKVYWGVSEPKDFTSSDILGLSNSALASGRGREFTVNPGANQHIIYAFPSSFGNPTFNIGGFDGGMKKLKTFEHTNGSGYKQNYDIWQSVQPNLGTSKVKVS